MRNELGIKPAFNPGAGETKLDWDVITEAYNDGWHVADIAALVGSTYDTVAQIIYKLIRRGTVLRRNRPRRRRQVPSGDGPP